MKFQNVPRNTDNIFMKDIYTCSNTFVSVCIFYKLVLALLSRINAKSLSINRFILIIQINWHISHDVGKYPNVYPDSKENG